MMKKLQRAYSLRELNILKEIRQGGRIKPNSNHDLEKATNQLSTVENNDRTEDVEKKKRVTVRRSQTVSFASNNTKHNKNQRCEICYQSINHGKQLVCLHIFCVSCLGRFINPKMVLECPTCRKVYKLDQKS